MGQFAVSGPAAAGDGVLRIELEGGNAVDSNEQVMCIGADDGGMSIKRFCHMLIKLRLTPHF